MDPLPRMAASTASKFALPAKSCCHNGSKDSGKYLQRLQLYHSHKTNNQTNTQKPKYLLRPSGFQPERVTPLARLQISYPNAIVKTRQSKQVDPRYQVFGILFKGVGMGLLLG